MKSDTAGAPHGRNHDTHARPDFNSDAGTLLLALVDFHSGTRLDALRAIAHDGDALRDRLVRDSRDSLRGCPVLGLSRLGAGRVGPGPVPAGGDLHRADAPPLTCSTCHDRTRPGCCWGGAA